MGYQRILCATDGSESSERALEHAARLAEELNTDVIVVGSRGRSAVGGAMLGSVSQRLPHETERPIVVVPARYPAPALQLGRLRRETPVVAAS